MTSWKLMTAMVTVFALSAGLNSAFAQQHKDAHEHAQKAKKLAFPECPVMGEPVDFSVKTDTPNGPVYFCCKKCIKKFLKNPAKYAEDVAQQRKAVAALPKIQVSCPVTGKPIDEKVFIGKGDKKTYFCCKGCVSKYKKNPAKYKAGLANSYTYQTQCPVMGEEIDPTAFITLTTGQRVFFCCPKCEKKFLKNPAKYAPKLEAQGTLIDPDNVKLARKDAHPDHPDASHEHAGHDH
ncbi:MAG: hypothetical protein ACE5EQ_02175 [Phycisphaerae bacterium]